MKMPGCRLSEYCCAGMEGEFAFGEDGRAEFFAAPVPDVLSAAVREGGSNCFGRGFAK